MKFRTILAALLGIHIFLIPALAHARNSVPIVAFQNVAVMSGSGKAISADQFKQALIAGAANKGWSLEPQSNGNWLGTLLVRGKHTLVARVSYANNTFSVVYESSDNLNYFVNEEGVPIIHPNANVWMQGLKEAIRLELIKY